MKRNSTELKVYYHGDKDKPVRKKNPNIADIDKQGYSNGSPHRTMSSLIINTPSGGIDMSNTGIPLWANGRILPPYSGIHQFDTTQVKEIPLAKTGGWLQEFQGTEGGSEVFRPQLKPMVDAFNREQQEQKRKLQQSISYQTQPMVAESTDTPSVKMQQEQQILAQERWAENKPVSRTAVTPEKYSNKIAEYSTKEDKEVLDKYYKKYDKATQDEVKAIQAELVANNFLPNAAAIDGKFGDKTKSAYLKYKAKQRVGDLSGETNKSSCSYDGCAEYVSSVTRPYGWVIGDAWEMKNNIESNGGVIKYNIYEDGRFSNVKNVQQLKNVTEQVKKNNKASSDMFQIGDVVGLYNKSSNMHPTALKDGRGTYNTHVGVVTDIKDGKPVISHNIHGKLHHDAFDNLSIGWIGSPASKIGQYKPKKEPNTLDEKINVYSKDLTEILAPGLDNKVLAENIKGILRLETGLGANKPSDSDISRTKVQRFILGEPTDESKISRGIGKLKTAGIPDEIKYFLDIKDDDVSDDAGIKGAIYKYIDAYSRFKKYSENNPQLHLTQDDIHNMSILAYNQGTGKLMNLGYNNPNMSIDEEVAKLRSLYRGNVKDISSTNYKYLPESMGQVLYNMEYPEGHQTYISRVNKYAITPFEKLMEGTVEPVKGEGVTSLDKKRKGGSKGWLKEFQGVKGSSQVNLVQAALNKANTSFQPTTTAVTKPVILPVPLANQPFPINVKIDDPRKIHPVTGQPINPNRDLKSGNYEGIVIKKIIDEGKKLGFNKNQVLDNIAIALQESGLGQYDDNIGHALHGNPITGMMNDVQVLPDLGDVQLSDIDAGIRNQYLNYKYNTQMINKNPKSDAELLQWYNTPYPKKGQLNTGTEKEYHTNTGRSTNRFYGVDVSKAPLKTTTLPYGKTIISLRDSLIASNADIQKMLMQAGYKKKGGSKLPKHQVPPGQFKVPASERDSVKNMAYKTMQYEKERGSAAGTGLSDFGNPKLPAGANINQAVDWYMDNIYPQLGAYSTAMEKAEAGDFLYNSGKDTRPYAIQEYLRKTDPQNKTGWQDSSGNWKYRKDASKWDTYWSEIQKLPTNDRRVFINKGRDWYYQNINNPSPGVPSDAYGNTWYGRIWNTNDYAPYNPNNPKFTPKQKTGGSKLPPHLPEAYRTGGWLKEFQGTEGTSQTGPVAIVNHPPVDIVGKKIPWYEKVGKYLQERTPGLMVRDLIYNLDHPGPWRKAPLIGPKAKEFEEGMARDREIKRKQQEDPEGYSVLPWVSPDYWAQNLAMDTRMLGKKLQVFPDYDSELEPWVNPMALVGAMAQPIGQAPAQAQQLYDEGYTIPEAAMPVALSFLNPFVAGRIPMSKAGILPAAELSTVNAGAGVWLDERGKRINQDLQIEKKKGGSKSKGWLNNL